MTASSRKTRQGLALCVTPGFLLLAAWLNYTDTQGVLLTALLSCALHELGHLAALKLLGAQVHTLRLSAVGAELCVSGTLSYPAELVSALAGPLTNLLLCACFCHWDGVFAGVNLALGLFNLLPVQALDGGRALSALLSWMLDPWTGAEIGRILSALTVLLLLLWGSAALLRCGNVTLALIGLWLCARGLRPEDRAA